MINSTLRYLGITGILLPSTIDKILAKATEIRTVALKLANCLAIYFKVTAFHYLRLFQPQVTLPNGKTMVAAEYYDEIVSFKNTRVYFLEPFKALYII